MISSQINIASASNSPSYNSNNLKRSTPTASNSSQNGSTNSNNLGNYHQQLIHGNAAYENVCLRCGSVVYQVDKIGPLKDFTFYHHGCFKCLTCGTKLTLKTYYNNQQDNEDKEVYCQSHVPKTGPGKLDGLSVGIKAALRAPKTSNLVNEQIRGNNYNPVGNCSFNGISTNNLGSHNNFTGTSNGTVGLTNGTNNSRLINMAGRFDASALHIQHGLNATKLQSNYRPPVEHTKIQEFLDEEEQRKLEMLHRAEEDALYRQFAKKRAEEETQISEEIREEWEEELQKLTSRLQNNNVHNLSKEKAHLEKNMTIKLDRKKETLTRKLLEQERQATAELVDKQSKEMINLITEKLFEYQNQTGDSIEDDLYNSKSNNLNSTNLNKLKASSKTNLSQLKTTYPSQTPPPSAPLVNKAELYTDPFIFDHIDQVAINVAREDQRTFTDLVRLLIEPCESDIEKARAIFRWITVKNLNTMQFDDNLNADTPMGILRGIKHGTESYHVLFKRLCSYAGLHCVVIKGYSKSAGYQPGVKFEDNRFRNSWNAVYVANGWRFVQCNWGARHLVNAKEIPKPGIKGKSDSLRYEYDDHYFLTDPREFIFEFYPLQHDWQLLKRPITLQEFEELPFVRSLFFRYGLYFPNSSNNNYGEICFDLPDRSISCKAVLHTDTSGAATVRIGMPTKLIPSLIFHYNLKFFDKDTDEYEGTSLKRYVMQSVSNNIVSFRVHAPISGAFIMDIFANATTPKEYVTGEPMKFKSVCKFKLIANDLQTVMVPLPMCASGEWGPMKATRLFGLISLTHENALIFCNDNNLEIQFRMSRQLTDFMASLHKNGVEEKKLIKYVSCHVEDDIVSLFVKFPEDGQYGLDIYTREVTNQPVTLIGEKQLLTHCCKYLVNVSIKRT